MKLILLLFIMGLIACGCSTTTSHSTPTPSSAVQHSTIITAQQEAEYIALASQYGYRFKPSINGSEAVPIGNGTYQLAPAYLAKYQIMLQWKKDGVK